MLLVCSFPFLVSVSNGSFSVAVMGGGGRGNTDFRGFCITSRQQSQVSAAEPFLWVWTFDTSVSVKVGTAY